MTITPDPSAAPTPRAHAAERLDRMLLGLLALIAALSLLSLAVPGSEPSSIDGPAPASDQQEATVREVAADTATHHRVAPWTTVVIIGAAAAPWVRRARDRYVTTRHRRVTARDRRRRDAPGWPGGEVLDRALQHDGDLRWR